MILHNKEEWVICTPPKTGSSSLISTLVERLKVAHKHRPNGEANRHGTDYKGKATRILIVRHGLERWSSLYWFAVKKKSQFLHKHTDDPNNYCEKWFESRVEDPHQINNMILLDYCKQFKPDRIFKLEDGLENLLKELGLPFDDVSQANINDLNFGWSNTKKLLSIKNVRNLTNLFKPELKLFKYENS